MLLGWPNASLFVWKLDLWQSLRYCWSQANSLHTELFPRTGLQTGRAMEEGREVERQRQKRTFITNKVSTWLQSSCFQSFQGQKRAHCHTGVRKNKSWFWKIMQTFEILWNVLKRRRCDTGCMPLKLQVDFVLQLPLQAKHQPPNYILAGRQRRDSHLILFIFLKLAL